LGYRLEGRTNHFRVFAKTRQVHKLLKERSPILDRHQLNGRHCGVQWRPLGDDGGVENLSALCLVCASDNVACMVLSQNSGIFEFAAGLSLTEIVKIIEAQIILFLDIRTPR
jgi:hypothetical protein